MSTHKEIDSTKCEFVMLNKIRNSPVKNGNNGIEIAVSTGTIARVERNGEEEINPEILSWFRVEKFNSIVWVTTNNIGMTKLCASIL